MKNLYLFLAIIGFIAPSVLVLMESVETGNFLLYANPVHTFEQMFANRISSIFAIDLLFAVLVFFIWTYSLRNKIGASKVYLTWILTMLFGLAGGFPLFLYWKVKARP